MNITTQEIVQLAARLNTAKSELERINVGKAHDEIVTAIAILNAVCINNNYK